MSPGTSVDIGISCGRSMPARSTAVVDVTIALSSSAALLERNSCQKRKSVLSNTIVLRTIIVLNVRSSGAAKITSVNSETTLTVNSTPLNGVTNAWKSCWYQVGGFSCDTSLQRCPGARPPGGIAGPLESVDGHCPPSLPTGAKTATDGSSKTSLMSLFPSRFH